MFFRPIVAYVGTLSVGVVAAVIGPLYSDENQAKTIQREFNGQKLELIQNSATYSQSLAINASGAVVGFREVPNADGTIMRNVYFYWNKDRAVDVPDVKGFTNVEVSALSDNHLVIGRVTRAIGAKDGSLRAMVWNPESGEVTLLPRPEGDTVCDAQDISADGTRITGYATGPERMRPVLWSWAKEKKEWSVTVLPTEHAYNPYVMSAQIVLTPDGQTAAGCCTERFLPDGTVDSALFKWTEVDGQWQRSLITKEQMYLTAINNRQQMVGSLNGASGRTPCLVTMDGKVLELELLEGDVGGQARDINNRSEIVGWSDDPPGPDGGQAGCRWTIEGKASAVNLSESGYSSVFAINDAGQMAGEVDVPVPGVKGPDADDLVLVLAFRTKGEK